jgi:RNA polymerase sigma-70 factor (ECF subfamily)
VNLKDHPQHDLKINLEAAITKLPEKMRICFTLFAIQGFKQEEIAEMLKLRIGTIKANIFHAKTRLKSVLKDLEVHTNDSL